MKHNKAGTKIARNALNGAIGKRGIIRLSISREQKYRWVPVYDKGWIPLRNNGIGIYCKIESY